MLKARWLSPHEALTDPSRWAALAASCASANVFYESWAVQACQALPEGNGLALLLVEDRDGRWAGLLPLMPWRVGGVMIGWQNWDQRVRALGDPLISDGDEAKVWQAMLSLLARDWRQPLLRLSTLDEDGVVAGALADILATGPWPHRITRRLARAVLHQGPTAVDYCAANIRGKVLKEYRRLKRRLADQGALRIERLPAGQPATGWTDQLLAMESAGWKGRDKVAAACDPLLGNSVHQLLDGAHRHGRLDFWRMTLDGVPLSMLACLENAQGRAFQYKISYDERFAASSPGVLLELEYLQTMLNDRRLLSCDSCARPDHPMINRLWVDRLPVCSLVIGQSTLVGRSIVGLSALIDRRRPTSSEDGVSPEQTPSSTPVTIIETS